MKTFKNLILAGLVSTALFNSTTALLADDATGDGATAGDQVTPPAPPVPDPTSPPAPPAPPVPDPVTPPAPPTPPPPPLPPVDPGTGGGTVTPPTPPPTPTTEPDKGKGHGEKASDGHKADPKPVREGMSEDVKKILEQYRAERETRAAKLKELHQQMGGAVKADKEKLRDQMRTIMTEQKQDKEAMREQIREQIKDRVAELGKDLSSRKELVDSAREKAKEQKPRSRGE